MTSRAVEPDQIPFRYETHRSKLLTLYVTRQDQEFVISSDLQLADVHLVRSSVELVGEPGWAPSGSQTGSGHTMGAYDSTGLTAVEVGPVYGSTVNELYALNKTQKSTFQGRTFKCAVEHKTAINHGWMDISIDGMTRDHQFMQDDRSPENRLNIVVPTDSGLISNRAIHQLGPTNELVMENVKLQQKIRIRSTFLGNSSEQNRTARFVEDFADEPPTDPAHPRRAADGSVNYYQSGLTLGECIMPANLVNCMVLQFKIMPRTQL